MIQNLKTAYDFDCVDLHGKAMPLAAFTGQPLLIVNTASKCGFTKQYAGLEAIWRQFKDQGLIVIGVPSNDFGKQEPGTGGEIASFCALNFGVTFPLLQKTPVAGGNAHPLFQWLRSEGSYWSRPHWNFYKYLIGRDGHLKNWWSSLTAPDNPAFQKAISDAVGEN